MEKIKASALEMIWLDDSHRAALSALCALRSVAGTATDSALLSEAQRLHSTLATAADEIAELRSRARMADA